MRVIVLGSGVIGVASAYYLAQQGAQVTVLDRQAGPAEETSFGNAGQISPGYSTPSAAPGIPFTDEMLVLCNFSSAQLNGFLGGFKRVQIPPVALKAVLTDTNLHWSAVMLQQELAQEHQALAAKAAQKPGSNS